MKINNLLIIAFEFSLIIFLAVSIFLFIRKNRDLFRLWVAYDIARVTGDKEKAYEAAKAFYKRKKGKLTVYDEQNIASVIDSIR